MRRVQGNNVALIGAGGGFAVLSSDILALAGDAGAPLAVLPPILVRARPVDDGQFEISVADRGVGMVVVRRDATLCTVTELGYAKRTNINEYPVQRRGGVGGRRGTDGRGWRRAARAVRPPRASRRGRLSARDQSEG